MGWKFRKKIKICKGLSVNINKNSIGLSVGTKGIHYTINSKGKQNVSLGIPRTGLYYTETYENKKIYNKHYSKLKIILAFLTFGISILFIGIRKKD